MKNRKILSFKQIMRQREILIHYPKLNGIHVNMKVFPNNKFKSPELRKEIRVDKTDPLKRQSHFRNKDKINCA